MAAISNGRSPLHHAIDYLTAALPGVQSLRRWLEHCNSASSAEIDQRLTGIETRLHLLGRP
jgi:hypothetical protein